MYNVCMLIVEVLEPNQSACILSTQFFFCFGGGWVVVLLTLEI